MDGRIVLVEERPFGSELTAAVVATDTVLLVEDATDFDDSGTLQVGDEVVAYTLTDEDGGELTLATPLADGHAAEDPVYIYPLTLERVAWLRVTEEDEELEARVPHSLYDRVAEGIRDDGEGESVEADYIGDELVLVDVLGKPPVIDGSYLSPGTVPGEAITDGDPPATSPTPTALGGVTFFALTWTAVVNNDPVEYEVHVSDEDDFTPDTSTHYGTVRGTIMFVKTQADLTPFAYDTTYYFKIVAADDDGSAAASAQDSAQLAQINSPDIAANAISAVHILAENITAEKLEAVLVLGTTLVAGALDAGRVEIGAGTGVMDGMIGIHAVDSDGETITFMVDAETGQVYVRGRLDFGTASRLLSEDIIELYESPTTGFQEGTLVQSARRSETSATGSATWGSATTKGNLLLMSVHFLDLDGTLPTPTTPSGWTLVADESQGTGAESMRLLLYKIEDADARTGTQTITLGDTVDWTLILLEFSGVELEDVVVTNSGTDSNPDSGTTTTTTQAEELWVAIIATLAQPFLGLSATNDFAFATSKTHADHLAQHVFTKNVTATGTANMGISISVSGGWIGLIATFKAKPAGIGIPDPDRVRLYSKPVSAAAALHAMHEDGYEGAVVVGTADEVWRMEVVAVTVDLPSTAAHTGAAVNVTIPGLAVGDLAFLLGGDGATTRMFIQSTRPVCATTDTIVLDIFNADAETQNPSSDTLRFLVIHRS